MIKTIIFDFGNVVGFFDHRKACQTLAGFGSCSAEEIYSFCFNNQLEDDLEAGRIEPEDFLDLLRRQFGLQAADRVLARTFSDIFWPNEEIIALLARLKPRFRLLLASNTSILHSQQFKEQFAEALGQFDALVLSHEIGSRKPNRSFYEHCLALSQCPANECVFIDDLAVNVAGAEACGLHGIIYKSIEDLTAQMAKLGIEPLPQKTQKAQ
ncbi:MAG: HAD family hydrolase [Gemmataceae bacterium]